MNRRKVLVGLLLAVMSESAQAQQTGKSKVYRIAIVDTQTPVAEQRKNPYSAGSEFFVARFFVRPIPL